MSSLVLLLNYFHESGDIGVRHLGDGDVDKTEGVMGLQGGLVNQFKLIKIMSSFTFSKSTESVKVCW